MDAQITPYLPSYVNLYYVDYRDDLSNSKETIQESLSTNSLAPIHDKVSEWWENPAGYEMREIEEKMSKDGLDELFANNEDEIRDWLHDNDKSTPVEDLLRNTGDITMFYSLGLEISSWHTGFMVRPYRNGTYAMDAYKVRRILGIKKGTQEADAIDRVVEQSGGGELRIYFSSDLRDTISNSETDFQQIHFKGEVAVAIYDPANGGGDFEYIRIDKTFPFVRENLYTSNSDKYPIEECFGMGRSWIKEYPAPTFSIEPLKTRQRITKSKNAEIIAREAELNRVFKAGGCTFGDMDFRRHRNTYYKNEIPCGTHCPHCGTFWID